MHCYSNTIIRKTTTMQQYYCRSTSRSTGSVYVPLVSSVCVPRAAQTHTPVTVPGCTTNLVLHCVPFSFTDNTRNESTKCVALPGYCIAYCTRSSILECLPSRKLGVCGITCTLVRSSLEAGQPIPSDPSSMNTRLFDLDLPRSGSRQTQWDSQ